MQLLRWVDNAAFSIPAYPPVKLHILPDTDKVGILLS